ncbi:alpha/beta hydrolase [Rhizobium sp. LjRoot254]|uniref:alpha/beta hydrolase n=1 Tax=Rhizobium sp. LjRoot254 TaxID=3342297 RepID=UPI003ECF520E
MLSSEGFQAGACRRGNPVSIAGLRVWFAACLFALFLLPLNAHATDVPLTLDGGISATLNMPDATQPVPAVLLLHGFGSSKDEVGGMYARVATALAQKGIASLRIDFAGFGKSDGDTGSTTVDAQLDQAKAALAVLKGTKGVDPNRVGVLGFSLGGGIALLVASGQPMDVKSLVTWSSVGDFQADMLGALGQKAFDRAKEDGIVGLDLGFRTIALKQSFFDSLSAFKLDDAIATYPGPYLTITGSKDFSAQYADRFVGLVKNPTKEAMIIPEGDHIFGVLGADQTMADSVIMKTAEWFAATL